MFLSRRTNATGKDGAATLERGLLAPFTVSFVAGWLVSNVGAIATSMADAYHISLTVVGVIASAAVATHAAMQVPAGRVVDRYGPRAAMLAGLAVLAAADGLGAITAAPALAVAARLVIGVGTALCFIGGSDLLREQRIPVLALGLYGGAGMSGAGLALALLPQVDVSAAWRASWLSACGLAIAGLLVVWPATRTRSTLPRRSRSGAARLSLVHDGELRRLALIYTASYGLSVLVGNWVETFLKRAGHYSASQAAAAGALTLFGGIISRPLGGWIVYARPWLARPIAAAGLLTGATGTALLLLAPPFVGGVLASSAVGLGAGLPFGPVFSSAQRLRRDSPAAAVGLVNFTANAVIVVGIPVVGLTFSLPGQGRIALAAVACLWAATIAVIPSTRALTTLPRPHAQAT